MFSTYAAKLWHFLFILCINILPLIVLNAFLASTESTASLSTRSNISLMALMATSPAYCPSQTWKFPAGFSLFVFDDRDDAFAHDALQDFSDSNAPASRPLVQRNEEACSRGVLMLADGGGEFCCHRCNAVAQVTSSIANFGAPQQASPSPCIKS